MVKPFCCVNMLGSDSGRTLCIVGAVLLFIGLIYSLIVLGLAIGSYQYLTPPYLALLIVVGVLLDIVCGSVLLFTKDRNVMIAAGVAGLISSICLAGGIIGGIGGILAIIGGALSSAQAPTSKSRTPNTFLKRCVKCGKEIPIASEECPYCGSKQP